MDLALLRPHLQLMLGSPVENYALPGLTSHMVCNGKVRHFRAERETLELIAPHSHRFDLVCFVLHGRVSNTIFSPGVSGASSGDWWWPSIQFADGNEFGRYKLQPEHQPKRYVTSTTTYEAGKTYAMKAAQIHSIRFAAGTEVLFFEGPELSESSIVLEPVANGERVPTFKTEPWMFKRGA